MGTPEDTGKAELVTIDDEHGEVSALLRCEHPELLERHGYDTGFWGLRDDLPAEKALVLVGHKTGRRPRRGWKLKRLKADVPKKLRKTTDDGEALARHAGWIYVLGSQFGSKSGPLDPDRAFIARFRETDIDEKIGRSRPTMQILRHPHALHRAINDALQASGIPLIPLGPQVSERFIEATLRAGTDAPWAGDVRVEDHPINVEGAVLAADGSCLLALRFPVSADGRPLLVRVCGIPQAFTGLTPPAFQAQVAATVQTGSREHPVGLRALQAEGEHLHLLTGPIGSIDKANAVAKDYPGSQQAPCRHWRCRWPRWEDLPEDLPLELVHACASMRVEGLAQDTAGTWHYSVDTPKGVHLGIGSV
ncbi:MAG: hypothetical protein ACOCXA_01280 [Planctomycetota bacterium]